MWRTRSWDAAAAALGSGASSPWSGLPHLCFQDFPWCLGGILAGPSGHLQQTSVRDPKSHQDFPSDATCCPRARIQAGAAGGGRVNPGGPWRERGPALSCPCSFQVCLECSPALSPAPCPAPTPGQLNLPGSPGFSAPASASTLHSITRHMGSRSRL